MPLLAVISLLSQYPSVVQQHVASLVPPMIAALSLPGGFPRLPTSRLPCTEPDPLCFAERLYTLTVLHCSLSSACE